MKRETSIPPLQLAALIAIGIGYVAHFRLLEARLQDDAFISFRYARHLAEGEGLVWNVGERVEGYTNFLWTLLLSIPFFASKAAVPIGFARAISSAAGIGTLAVSFLITRRMAPRRRWIPLVAPGLLAASWPLAINTMTGLETVFFGALISLATFLVILEAEDLRYRGSSIVYALAALTRPEAVGLSLVVFSLVALGHRGRGPAARRHLAWIAIPFAAIVGAHEAFRLAYYGALVPNTFFAKFGVSLPPELPTRGSYLLDFLTKGLDPICLTAALAALFVAVNLRDPRARIISFTALFGFVNVAVSGADFMVGYRYLVPYLPMVCVAAALGGAHLADRCSRAWAHRLEVGLCALVVAAYGYHFTRSRDRLRPFEELRHRVTVDANAALGSFLAASLPAGTSIATLDIGEIGFRSGLPVIDISGLTDPAIARRPGNLLDRALDLDDLFGRHPGGFVLISRIPGPVAPARYDAYYPPGSSRAILTDPRMEAGYTFVARYPSYERLAPGPEGSWQPAVTGSPEAGEVENSYFLELYLRKDVAAAAKAP